MPVIIGNNQPVIWRKRPTLSTAAIVFLTLSRKFTAPFTPHPVGYTNGQLSQFYWTLWFASWAWYCGDRLQRTRLRPVKFTTDRAGLGHERLLSVDRKMTTVNAKQRCSIIKSKLVICEIFRKSQINHNDGVRQQWQWNVKPIKISHCHIGAPVDNGRFKYGLPCCKWVNITLCRMRLQSAR